MATRLDTDVRNLAAQAIADAFSGGTAEIRTGTQPTTANDAATGTLLSTITLPTPAFTAASGGAITKNGTWTDTVDATGTAGYVRLIGGTSAIDLAVGAEVTFDNPNLVAGGTATVTAITITVPAG